MQQQILPTSVGGMLHSANSGTSNGIVSTNGGFFFDQNGIENTLSNM